MATTTSPVILDSTGQDIVTQLATISAALAADIVITGNTDTTLSGVLQGTNGKVGVKSVDASPTADSTNLVSSGGTDKAIKGRVPVYGMGKNLLDNWYFGNPVNQRGQSSYTAPGGRNYYTIDRWFMYSSGTPITINAGNITLGPKSDGAASLTENLSLEYADAAGKAMTVSCLLADGSIIAASNKLPTTTPSSNTSLISAYGPSGSSGYYARLGYNNRFYFILQTPTNTSFAVVAAKLEFGSEQTLCHNEGTAANPVWVLNDVPDYQEELFKCSTSTADSTDTYANKTLATEEEIAYVENGTTASRAYTFGEYFCWHGLLYQVTAAISSGDTFTPGTNCKATTVGSNITNIYRLVYDSNQQCFPAAKKPKAAVEISFIARNPNTGAIYVVWYRNASQGFVIGSTISGSAPANGDVIYLLY